MVTVMLEPIVEYPLLNVKVITLAAILTLISPVGPP